MSQVLGSALLYCMDFGMYGDWRSDLATRRVLFSYLGFYLKSFESSTVLSAFHSVFTAAKMTIMNMSSVHSMAILK